MESVKEQLIRMSSRARTDARTCQEEAKQMRIDADLAEASAALLMRQADEYDSILASKYGDEFDHNPAQKFTDYMPR